MNDRTKLLTNFTHVLFIVLLSEFFDLIGDGEYKFRTINGVYSGYKVGGFDC
jgi:hypothetical protein